MRCGVSVVSAKWVSCARRRAGTPRGYAPARGGQESAAYQSYAEELTYRRAGVCPGCYARLDSPSGTATIGGKCFTMAGQPRRGRAVTLTEARYRAWQRREAGKLGLDTDPTADGA
jgi:hypothetical protein